MRKTVKCDADLLKLLQQSDSKEVDFLVDVLTDNGAGRISLSSAVKDLLLHQKAECLYTEDGLRFLLHEFQEFGGHSMVNFFRSEPLPYPELLTDVHKKLNGKDSIQKTVFEKERETVLSLLGDCWRTMPDHERWERCTELKVVGGFFNMQDHLNVDARGMVVGLSAAASSAAFIAMRMFPPAAIAGSMFPAYQSMSVAYRITVPFVVQIARMKMIIEQA
ncbi:hypothetical protein [Halopseudomonas sp.]|uniref:hypothetical protein n=1 Tax=Halopseudomonas sp. TaxID=2901191 RepID=UPI0030017F6D